VLLVITGVTGEQLSVGARVKAGWGFGMVCRSKESLSLLQLWSELAVRITHTEVLGVLMV